MQIPTTIKKAYNNLPLRRKILFPFFLILIMFGCAVSYGTYHLIRETLISTANQRLMAIQEMVFREVKKQEFLLQTYAKLIESQQDSRNQLSPGAVLQQDKFLRLLGDENITAMTYPASADRDLGALAAMQPQTIATNQPSLRFLSTSDVPALLSVAIPLPSRDHKKDILLLQTPLSTAFLKEIVAPFHTAAAILDLSRKPLLTTMEDFPLNGLSEDEMTRLRSGEKITRTIEHHGYHRQLYSAVPIGSSDTVILAIDLPLTDLNLLLETLATRAGLTLLAAIALGATIFFRLIKSITRPLKTLLIATKEISNGNLDYRITDQMTGEFQHLAEAFNQMLSTTRKLHLERTEQEKNLAITREQLHFNQLLKEKNQEIERTNQELRIHLQEISMLLQLNQVMNSTLELAVIFDRTLNLLHDFLGNCDLTLFLYDQESGELTVHKSIGTNAVHFDRTYLNFSQRKGRDRGAQEHDFLYVRDMSKEQRYPHDTPQGCRQGSFVSAPLATKNSVLGLLNLHKPEAEAFNETELPLIRATTNQLAVAVENAQLYEKTRTLSNTDELTKIPNRRFFLELLHREFTNAQRFHTSFSVIMADIDHFKEFNDTFGHLNGDQILNRVATILQQSTRGVDLVARFGGEEFIIFLSKTDKENAFRVAEKLRHAVAAEEFHFAVSSEEKITKSVTISLGIATYPIDCNGVETLIEKADQALYAAKGAGRNCSRSWSASLTRDREENQLFNLIQK